MDADAAPPRSTEAAVRYEPSNGTGTGSEVVDVVREGENAYHVTTKDGHQDVIDEATLTKLPQGMAKLAPLHMRERAAPKNTDNGHILSPRH